MQEIKNSEIKLCPFKQLKGLLNPLRRKLLTNCFSVFDDFVGLALKGLIMVELP